MKSQFLEMLFNRFGANAARSVVNCVAMFGYNRQFATRSVPNVARRESYQLFFFF